MTHNQKHNKDFYFEYHRLGNKAFRDKVRYYEDNRSYIQYLSYEERIDVDLDYAICLFEIGKYHKFLSKADGLIEAVIMDNIFSYNGVNIYNDLLIKKAACLHNTGQYVKSEKVLLSILKIIPDSDIARILFGKCKRKQNLDRHEGTKAIALLFMLFSLILAVTQFSIEVYFQSKNIDIIGQMKILFGGLGLFLLIANEAYLYYIIGKAIGFKFDFSRLSFRSIFRR